MARDTLVSWQTFALFVLFPPAALVALVFFPLTLLVFGWLYYRGKYESIQESDDEQTAVEPSDAAR
ncbi:MULTISPECIES: hypothetical protein [Haloferax]|jgi:hypothetical protein|uniref:Uncharacterized protein n=5 Tax=Haloferax TaxID=2251 RepID=D4GPT5_HALVD|nr:MULTISPECIES: hypothetical protein [Haloferax]ADE01453.1 uncharacterized protein HVO_B0288 [Haloferax volcanii DS2]ELK46953.1 hypothetical protein D320_20419 [Haloferax sp. BAB-2207]ELY36922.1 hypothetical protein C498_02210 [Haloferax volcanii DS2]ELZ77580.1 hypothetical protein C456_02411 [Haloferax lucentense DSM 14919]MBC9988141.1 hypothetical protein [Haloferax sp. AS1]